MNFFDFDLATSTTPPPQATGAVTSAPVEPSLNEEVSQVVGQLGRLWGGFRKQSQIALDSARKDLSSVVAQAQKELGKLSEPAEPVASSSKVTTDDTSSPTTITTTSEPPATSETDVPTSDAKEVFSEPSSSAAPTSPFQSFFSRVQSSLPPNISSTLERNIPASLKDPSGHVNVDFSQLKATLTSEFQRVQGVTRAQADEYVHKSEALLKEAGEFLKDAVKVIPPEEQEHAAPEIMFDGTDIAVMPPAVGSFGPGSRDFVYRSSKGKGRETAAQAQRRIASSRAATMLSQLNRDAELLKQDPAANESVKAAYEAWLEDEVLSKDGGLEGTFWSERIKLALTHKDNGEALGTMLRDTVPATLDASTFWSRYFFQVHQIEKDEEKRKELLAASGSVDTEEDFSWEDEDDDDDSTTPPVTSAKPQASSVAGALHPARTSSDTLQPEEKATALASYPSSLVTSPSSTSPRESTDGYDVVSSGSGGGKSPKEGRAAGTKPEEKVVEDGDDADSDWE